MLYRLRAWRRRRQLARHPIAEPLWQRTVEAVPLLQGLSVADRGRLRELAAVFIQEKAWFGSGGLEVAEHMQAQVAAIGVLPVLNLGLDWYRGWKTIILYPGEYVQRRREVDAIGVEHHWDEVRAGEAWERGPVVLSWASVAGAGAVDGYNVVIHELAHKLDMLNGPPDGFPPLHRGMSVRRWAACFTAAFEALQRQVDGGQEPVIDPYAAEHPAEFFAVASEYFFELPEWLRQAFPAVYGQLAAFYRQDPLAWPRRAG